VFFRYVAINLQHYKLSKPKRLQSEQFPLLKSENVVLRPNFIALFGIHRQFSEQQATRISSHIPLQSSHCHPFDGTQFLGLQSVDK
jgi:hypothetical protein